jgi:hypothetical protein
MQMKLMSILLVIAWAVVGGCADPIERRSTEELQGQFERGITGQGQLTPIERAPGDPASEHSVPETHP